MQMTQMKSSPTNIFAKISSSGQIEEMHVCKHVEVGLSKVTWNALKSVILCL